MRTYKLPYPPSVNQYWRSVLIRGRRRILISASGRKYKTDVKAIVGDPGQPLTGRLQVTIMATMPDRRTRDIDNLAKSALDALTNAGVWLDDGQIDDLRIIRAGVEKPGYVVVTITEINDVNDD